MQQFLAATHIFTFFPTSQSAMSTLTSKLSFLHYPPPRPPPEKVSKIIGKVKEALIRDPKAFEDARLEY
jgi:hypothetical protein